MDGMMGWDDYLKRRIDKGLKNGCRTWIFVSI